MNNHIGAMRSACALLTLTFSAVAGSPEAAQSPTFSVDLTPAITIGNFTTSRYLVDKAYQQFVTAKSRQAGRKPNDEETAKWFRLYVAQLVIKAELQEHGQVDRPEVVDVTARMARYMLTQPHGPLYHELAGPDALVFREERRKQILEQTRFSAFPEAIDQLWMAIAPALSRGAQLQEFDVAPIASAIVAVYFVDDVQKQISAVDFVRDFQQSIARMSPRDPPGLARQIEDMVLAEFDWKEAKRRGIDQSPQFGEDQRNFALNQTLVLYEAEVLAKQVIVSSAEVAARYQANLQRYMSPVEITGVLSLYSSFEKARQGLGSVSTESAAGAGAPPDKVIGSFTIRPDDPLAGIPYDLLTAIPIGRSHGPFRYAGKYATFQKRSVGKLAPMPLGRVRSDIQQQLTREKIESLELEHLARNTDRVQVCLDLANYGLHDSALLRQ